MSARGVRFDLCGVCGRRLELPRLTFVLYKARPRRHPLPKGCPGLPGRPGEACVCVGGRGERV